MADPRIDEGALRDKVAAPDPAAVSQDADSEAGAAPSAGERQRADAAQARLAQQKVPRLDPDRAVSTHDRDYVAPERRRQRELIWIASLVLLVAAVTAALIALTV